MNRQVVPNSLYPLTGDVKSTAGENTAKVTGIQGVPVSSTIPFRAAQILAFNPGTNQWEVVILNGAVLVNGILVSAEPIFTVNSGSDTLIGTIEVNGTPV